MNNPLVSVIIPNYNHARFLDERIQSVLNQTYHNFEMIILDDKSTDNSVEVINKYINNPHVSHVVINEENCGSTFKQWHKGFELAKGEIVWIAESDDSCDKLLLDTLVRGYLENNAILAFCRSCCYDVDGNKRVYSYQHYLSGDIVMAGRKFISSYMVQYNAVANASSAIFDRKIAMSLDKQYMSMHGEGDWLFWIEMMEHGNVSFCTKELNYFRFHATNTTSQYALKGIGDIEHKIVFDYLVKGNHLTSNQIRTERLRYLDVIVNRKYESEAIRKEVLRVWDKYRKGRLRMFGSFIKRDILFLIRYW